MKSFSSLAILSCAACFAACAGESSDTDPMGVGGAAGASAGSAGDSAMGGSSTAGQTSTAGQAGATGGAGGGAIAGDSAGGSAGSADGGSGGDGPTLPQNVLLYHRGAAGVIPDIDTQLTTLEGVLTGWGYESEVSEDPAAFTDENLARFGAVAMVNTCFSPFGDGDGVAEAEALQRFVQAGGGLFGTHCASVTYQSANPPALYNEIIGGRGNDGFFDGESSCRTMGAHASTAEIPAEFSYNGNLDNTDFLADDVDVLVRCVWSGNGNRDVAVSWVRTDGLGRVFFSNFAKLNADLIDPVLGDKHVLMGLSWVLRR